MYKKQTIILTLNKLMAHFFYLILDKVQNVRIDLDNKKVFVTSSELNADQLLEVIKKTGKTTNYIGLAK